MKFLGSSGVTQLVESLNNRYKNTSWIPTLNDLGVTATSDELNKLDGMITTTIQLNYLEGLKENAQAQINEKQETLVSGSNIKTINNESILGQGDIAINYVYPEIQVEGTSINQEIQPNTYYKFGTVDSLTLSFGASDNTYNEYCFQFTSGDNTTISLPSSIKWANNVPLEVEPTTVYRVSIINNLGVYYSYKESYLIYKTTSDNQNIKLLNNLFYVESVTLEDGTSIPLSGLSTLKYTFPTAGEHKVQIKFKSDATSLVNYFNRCSSLTSIPENLFSNCTQVTDFSNCFYDCDSLTSIPENLFANCTQVTNFYNCFGSCRFLTGTTPTDSDGGQLWEREGKEGYPTSINSTDCFYGCTRLDNYNDIPDDWK